MQMKIRKHEQNGTVCLEGCCASSCEACLQYSNLLHGAGTCRWCPQTQSCHNKWSPTDTCPVPINSLNQCWGQECPAQIGGMLSTRPAAMRQWAKAALDAFKPLHPFQTYQSPTGGLFDLATGQALAEASQGSPAFGVRLSVASDWGSGTCEARVVSKLMQAGTPDIAIHMGDVYYTGEPSEFETNMLGQPPNENQIGVSFPRGKSSTFFMNGNHEIISGCKGLMDTGFQSTGQETTYMGWQSDSWRFIALDTGYDSYWKLKSGTRIVVPTPENPPTAPQPQAVIDWLVNVVKVGDETDKRGLVLFTHHQPFSDFSSAYLGTAKQLTKILPPGKQVLWFAGHEHSLAFYDEVILKGTTFSTINRMVGNGGMFNNIAVPARTTVLLGYDNRVYQRIPNDLGGQVPVGFNGFFNISVAGPKLEISYFTGKCKPSSCDDGYEDNTGTFVAKEEVTVDLTTGKLAVDLRMSKHLTIVSQPRASGPVPVFDILPRPVLRANDTAEAVQEQLKMNMD